MIRHASSGEQLRVEVDPLAPLAALWIATALDVTAAVMSTTPLRIDSLQFAVHLVLRPDRLILGRFARNADPRSTR